MAKQPKDKCRSCVFRSKEHSAWKCDHLHFTGRTRLAQLPSECTYYINGPRLERTDDMPAILKNGKRGRQSKFDWHKGRELYDAGKTDREIAAALGCSQNGVWDWRKRNGLPANGERGWYKGKKRKE